MSMGLITRGSHVMIEATLTDNGQDQANLEEMATHLEYPGFGERMSTSLKQALPGVLRSQLWKEAPRGVVMQPHTSGD